MAERHYKREKVRGISLERERLWSSKRFIGDAIVSEKLFSI